jgi:hypothetical protein
MEHCLYVLALCGEPGGGVSFLGTLRDMSGKVLEGEHLSLYKDSVRGTWREGSHTEDSKRHVIEHWKRSISFLQWLHKGNRKVFSKGGLCQYVYWATTCS